MDHILNMNKMYGVGVGYHSSNLEPLDGKGRVGKYGIDKDYTLEQVMELAYEIKANIIVKAGPRAKWYLKRFDKDSIDDEIRKQKWRDTSRSTMWVVEWE
jgi:hypothetical protein